MNSGIHSGYYNVLCIVLSIQVDPAKYRNMFYALRLTATEEGVRALGRGWAPTLIGYSMQGLFKFGFYEVFKIFYANILGEVSTSSPHSLPYSSLFLSSVHRNMPTSIVPLSTLLPVPVQSSLQTLLLLLWRQ